MLRPQTGKKVWLGAAAAGVGMMLLGGVLAQFGYWAPFQLLVPFGVLLVIFGLIFGLHAARDARFEAKLLSGEDVIARWRVAPADWEKFAAFDAARGLDFPNHVWLPSETPPDGVEIIIGSTHLMLGLTLVSFKDPVVNVKLLTLVQLPSDPPCIELAIRSIDKHESVFYVRLPVPDAARAETERAIAHLKRCRLASGAQIAQKRFRYDLGKNVPEGIAQTGLGPRSGGFVTRNRSKVRLWGCSTALFLPLLSAPIGGMVGRALGPEWAMSTIIGAVAIAFVIGIGTMIATKWPSPA